MLDSKLLRQNAELIAEKLAKKHFDFDVASFRKLDDRRKQSETESQSLLAERKQASKRIGELVKNGIDISEAKQTENATLEKIAQQLESLKQKAQRAGDEIDTLMMNLPNTP